MDDLIAFLRLRLDEDEQTARDATPGPWYAVAYRDYDCEAEAVIGTAPDDDDAAVVGHGYEGGGVWRMDDARHIARHDPARVVADVHAKRRLIEKYERAVVVERGHAFTWRPPRGPVYTLDYSDNAKSGLVGLGYALRLLATAHGAHPDYRPEWAPEEA